MTKKQHKDRSTTPPIKQKYDLILRNSGNFQEKKYFHFSKATLLVYVVVLCTLPIAGGIALGLFVAPYFDKAAAYKADMQSKLVELVYMTDSLRTNLDNHQQYIQSLQAIFTQNMRYLSQSPTFQAADVDSARRDSSLSELFALENLQPAALLESMLGPAALTVQHLYSPLSGFISDYFSFKDAHYGVDIVAPDASTIEATADGRVIFSGWTEQDGYVITLQHTGDLVSVYKHNRALFKYTGQSVYAGESIAVIGNTGMHSTGTHLHFELWYKGVPINPANFIIFY